MTGAIFETMEYSMKTVLVIACILAICRLEATAEPTEGVVQIFTRYQVTKKVGYGSGFFLQIGGKWYVVTAYHVVQDADEIIVVDRQGNRFRSTDAVHDELEVIAYGKEDHDLALLRIVKPIAGLKGLQLDEKALRLDPESDAWPLAGSEVHLIGHPQFISYLHLFGRTIRNSFLKSREFKTISGTKIFSDAPVIDLLAVDVTIGSGMSGGPVLLQNKVIGVASGSIQKETVGTIGWAIPIKELRDFVESPGGFTSFKLERYAWPKQKLITSGFAKARRSRSLDFARKIAVMRDLFARGNVASFEEDRDNLLKEENKFIRVSGQVVSALANWKRNSRSAGADVCRQTLWR